MVVILWRIFLSRWRKRELPWEARFIIVRFLIIFSLYVINPRNQMEGSFSIPLNHCVLFFPLISKLAARVNVLIASKITKKTKLFSSQFFNLTKSEWKILLIFCGCFVRSWKWSVELLRQRELPKFKFLIRINLRNLRLVFLRKRHWERFVR